MRNIAALLFCTSASAMAACGAATIPSGDFVVDKEHYESAETFIRERASSDLACDASSLGLVTLQAAERCYGYRGCITVAEQIGVIGCGKRAIYVETGHGWVMSSPGTE